MAQNISLLGNSYSAVPSVNLPKTGGGTASFVDVTDTTASASDVANGKYFYTAAGVRTAGTSSGGGSSMNVQVAQSTERVAGTTWAEVISLTCATAGTYDIYWSTFRTNTSGSSGSRFYINDQLQGSSYTTFTNHIQNIHLTGVTLAQNDKVAVWTCSRGSNYYGYVGTLIIKQTA